MQDIYFEANYGKLYEKMEDGKSEYYEFSNQYGSITNVFIKREVLSELTQKSSIMI